MVRPKVMTSVHFCPATSKTMERNYSDMTSIDAYPSTAAYPTQVSKALALANKILKFCNLDTNLV